MYETALRTALGLESLYSVSVGLLLAPTNSVIWVLSDIKTNEIVTNGVVDLDKWQSDLLEQIQLT